MAQLLPRLEFMAQSLLRRQRTCPHCKSSSRELLARKYAVIRVQRCADCGLVFTDPIYRTAFGENFYDTLYAAEGSTTALPDEETLAQLLECGFAGSDKDARDRIERIKQVVEGRTLLELGSSWGYFLHQAEAGGFQATGVEIGDTRREFGREKLGVQMVTSLTELPGRLFDVIYTAHVLEHFTDLSTIFTELRDFLNPEGRLFLEVPRFAFDERGKDALSAVGAIHPLGYTNEFFRDNLTKHGFEIVGFFDSWNDLPQTPKDGSGGGEVLLIARRV